jgi:2-dehydropantoate 2-reductase
MRFLIVGPGAVGCLLSCLLFRGGQEVELLDYRQDRAERISKSGLRLEGVSGEGHYYVPVSAGVILRDPDIVILCVKAYKTREACEFLKAHLETQKVVLTLQNGVGNREIMEEVLSQHLITAGVTSEGATLLGEGHVRHAGKGETIIGRGSLSPTQVQEIVDAFVASGLNTRWAEDVTGLIWGKLLVNVGINALTAIARVRNGVLVQNENLKAVMSLLVKEALEVIGEKGIKLPFEHPLEKVFEVAKNTGQNISSMLQDVLKGKRTEISFMNGAIVSEGKKLGVPTPLNELITRLVMGIEETHDRRVIPS